MHWGRYGSIGLVLGPAGAIQRLFQDALGSLWVHRDHLGPTDAVQGVFQAILGSLWVPQRGLWGPYGSVGAFNAFLASRGSPGAALGVSMVPGAILGSLPTPTCCCWSFLWVPVAFSGPQVVVGL